MSEIPKHTPIKPHMVLAHYYWMMENGWVADAVIDTTYKGVRVPPQFIQDGTITLNISTSAVSNFFIEDNTMCFVCRFGGKTESIRLPLMAFLLLRARGLPIAIAFPVITEVPDEPVVETPAPKLAAPVSSRPTLKVVK